MLQEKCAAAVLIVEDDAAQCNKMRLLLEESDYNVISCESGEMAELILEAPSHC
jgi:DNA-binding response OmpR family regulator